MAGGLTGGYILGAPGSVNVLSDECVGKNLFPLDDALASALWSANLCVYVPMILSSPMVCTYMFWENGTAVAGNTEVAIYDFAGTTEIVGTGPVANSGTSVIQTVNVTDTIIPSGVWLWLCLGCDSSSQTYIRANAATQLLDAVGVKQASEYSSGIPSTITLSTPSAANMPFYGFSSMAVI